MESKVVFKLGNLEFTAEGDPKWVAGEFQKVINSLPNVEEAANAPQPKKRRGRPAKKATAAAAAPAKPAGRRGRPKGSTNKPKTETKVAATKPAGKRGRPKGSTNKPKAATKAAATKPAGRRGRPKGSTNKPKTTAKKAATTAALPTAGLADFLKKHNAVSNQTKRFLATSVFLHNNGVKVMTTREVTNALKDISMPKLTNASQALKNNADKGYATKNGRQFSITKDGVNLFK